LVRGRRQVTGEMAYFAYFWATPCCDRLPCHSTRAREAQSCPPGVCLDLLARLPPPLMSFTGFRSRIMSSFMSLLTRRQTDRTTLMFGIWPFIPKPLSPSFRSNVLATNPIRAREKLFLSTRPIPTTGGHADLVSN